MLKRRKQTKTLPWRKPQKSNRKKAAGVGLVSAVVAATTAVLTRKKDHDR